MDRMANRTSAPLAMLLREHRLSWILATAASLCAFAIAIALTLSVYVVTLNPTTPFWDCGEFITTSHIVGVPHQPGTPLYVLMGRVFDVLLGSADITQPALRTAWESRFADWRERHPERAAEWDAVCGREVPGELTVDLMAEAPTRAAATRVHGGAVLQQAAARVAGLASLPAPGLSLRG